MQQDESFIENGITIDNQSKTPSPKMLSKEMHKLISTGEKECRLCYCLLRNHKATFKIYKISLL